MREIEIQGAGRVLIPDTWSDERVKAYILELKIPVSKKGKIPESSYSKEHVPQSVEVPPMKFRGTITLDTSDHTIKGDLGDLLPLLQEQFFLERKNDWWIWLPGDQDALVAFIAGQGYEVKFVPSQSSGGPDGRDAGTSRGSGGGAHPHASPSAAVKDSTLVTGLIDQISEKMTKGSPPTEKSKGRASAPYLSILLQTADRKKTFYSCFDHDMFPYLQRAKAKQELCRVLVKKSGQYLNIVGLKNVGTTEFDDDGKTVVVQQKDREAGQRTLY